MAQSSNSNKKDPLNLDYYAILSLSTRRQDPSLSPSEVKAAYKRALLQHHPDKKAAASQQGHQKPSGEAASNAISIDSIALAYKILSSPALKAEYDVGLQTSRGEGGEDDEKDRVFRTGLETVDLDDLVFDDGEKAVWTRGCRCGDDKGFVVTEAELEENEGDGELITGCRGCSLWLRVLFGVEEEA